MANDQYLIWSNEHKAWWGPGRAGYVKRIANAGCYTYQQALQICCDAMPGRRGKDPFQEIPVRLADIETMLAWWGDNHPDHPAEPPER